MATINRDTRVGLSGMISGLVDRQWAKHHYRLWYEEHFSEPPSPPAPAAQPDDVAAEPELPRAPLAEPELLHTPLRSLTWQAAYEEQPEAKTG